jgi:hypothetical protein
MRLLDNNELKKVNGGASNTSRDLSATKDIQPFIDIISDPCFKKILEAPFQIPYCLIFRRFSS